MIKIMLAEKYVGKYSDQITSHCNLFVYICPCMSCFWHLLTVNMTDPVYIWSGSCSRNLLRSVGQLILAQQLASRPDPSGQNLTRSSRTKLGPGWFCTIWSRPSLEEWNQFRCAKQVAGQLQSARTGPNDSCTAACFRARFIWVRSSRTKLDLGQFLTIWPGEKSELIEKRGKNNWSCCRNLQPNQFWKFGTDCTTTHTHTHTHTYTQITIYFQFYIWTARQVESNFFFIRISQLYESQYTERTLTKTLNFVQVIKILNNETLLVKMDYAEHNPNWPTWGRLGHPWSRSGSSKSGSFQESCADAFSANHCICELFYLQRSQKSFWQCHHQHSPHIHSQ